MIKLACRVTPLVFVVALGCRAHPQEGPAKAAESVRSPAPVVHFGRLVDVYGTRRIAGTITTELHDRDVLVGPALAAQAGAGFTLLPCNPYSGRPRIRIDADIGSEAFAAVLHRLEGSATELGSVVPCDAALCVTWPAGVPAGLASKGDPAQLLERVGHKAVPVRVVERGNCVLVDPVVSGVIAARRGIADVPGMPESLMRLQVRDGDAETSWDFRAQGRLPDTEPPRIVGEMTVHLERVGRLHEDTRVLTLFLGGIRQALDTGDILCLRDPATNRPLAAMEVQEDVPLASIGETRAHVRVRMERGDPAEDVLERWDPSKLAGFPSRGGAERDAFVLAKGPKISIVACFEPDDGDDPANFVRIGGKGIEDTERNRMDVSPHAGFEVRFTAPVDPATLQNLQIRNAAATRDVPLRLFAVDDTGRSFRVQAPLGLLMTQDMRRAILADRGQPAAVRHADYVFTVTGGPNGVRSTAGVPMPDSLALPFALDPDAADNVVGWHTWVLPAK